MVAKANKSGKGLGGAHSHLLVSFGHVRVWDSTGSSEGPALPHGADMIYFQGHSSPGVYARAFVEGRLKKEQLENFRQEVDGQGAYPHTRTPG